MIRALWFAVWPRVRLCARRDKPRERRAAGGRGQAKRRSDGEGEHPRRRYHRRDLRRVIAASKFGSLSQTGCGSATCSRRSPVRSRQVLAKPERRVAKERRSSRSVRRMSARRSRIWVSTGGSGEHEIDFHH